MPLFTLAFCRLVLTYFPKPFEIQISSIHAKSLDELSLPPFLDLATWQMTCRSQCIRPIVVHDMQSVGFCDYSSLEDKETCQYNKQRIIYTAARMLCQALTKTAPRCVECTSQRNCNNRMAQKTNIPLNQY